MKRELMNTILSKISQDVSYGYTESANKEEVGPHFLRITDIQNGIVNWDTVPFCPIDQNKLSKYKLKFGDIVVARTGNSTGENYIFTGKKETVYASYLIRFRINPEKADPFFVWYNMRSPRWWGFIESSKTGSAQAGANAKVLGEFTLQLPPLPEQKAIAHVLGSLDDRIELNRRMNETLEGMAQALFKSWFVDFDPVLDNAIASGKEIPPELKEKATARSALGDKRHPLPKEIRTLFPNEFTYSDELGWIPKGWEVKPVNKFIDINPRIQLKKGAEAKFVDMKALPTTGFSVANVMQKPYSGGAKFKNGDILLARITPCLENGKTAVVDFLEEDETGFGSTEFIVLRGKNAISTPFIACLARDINFRKHCMQSMVGSTGRQRVQNSCFSSYYLSLPAVADLLSPFKELTGSIFDKFVIHREEAQVLTKLRDTLLPKLLSGEIRIQDAEKMVAGIKG